MAKKVKQSAGLLMFRRTGRAHEVFLVHPGGPYFSRKDEGAWTIPKGEFDDEEEALAAAQREFTEETSFVAKGSYIELGSIRQKSGKIVHAWAFEGDCDASTLVSNTCEIEWPPRSGRKKTIPEIPEVGLRTELALLALQFAQSRSLLMARTDGAVPGVIFGESDSGLHGNFHTYSYRAIRNHIHWAKRLEKVHTAYKRSRARADWAWKELDCAHSSDALLMNIFCYPGIMAVPGVRSLIGTAIDAVPEFGVKPRTPLSNGRFDNSEIDMRLGSILFEAKLTESNFQTARLDLVERYRDFEEVFDRAELPVRDDKFFSYQLIRGVLAAHAANASFCVLCDARRPDLMEAWYRIMRAVRLFDLRCRLQLLTWQELASHVPADLQQYLAEKYGIHPR
jgi:predicted NUDIX family NTP pyrophosphohydrolase